MFPPSRTGRRGGGLQLNTVRKTRPSAARSSPITERPDLRLRPRRRQPPVVQRGPNHGLAAGPALSPGRDRSMFGVLRRGMSHGISINAKLVSAGFPRGQSQPSSLRSIRVAVSAHHQTPYNTRVRKGRARVGDERLYRSHRWKLTEETIRILLRVRPPGRVGPTARSRRLH